MKTTNSPTLNRRPTLGIDIGRVIISGDHGSGKGDTSFFSGNDAALFATPMVPGAFTAIATLVEHFEGRASLVSKCGPNVAGRSIRWLTHHDFWNVTGISCESVRFCKERREKAGICKQLAVTHFIDDKVDVIASLDGIVENRFLFGPQRALAPTGALHTPTWADVVDAIDAALPVPAGAS
jgi:hypothetical protein